MNHHTVTGWSQNKAFQYIFNNCHVMSQLCLCEVRFGASAEAEFQKTCPAAANLSVLQSCMGCSVEVEYS
jgi:hypothetical protein